MRVNENIKYEYEKSYERLQEILDSTETFDEVDSIPNSERLTYNNGFYINCYSIFIDVRDSSKLPEKYKKSTLAKIYRAYISEIVAYWQSMEKCKEINIVGDSVWAVFEYNSKEDSKAIFSAAYTANSIVQVLNYKLCHKNINPITIGIGIDRGQALMIKAGFSGSGINDVIYMGGVVNNASKLCSKASKAGNSTIILSELVYNDLQGYANREGKLYQSMLYKKIGDIFYHGDVINLDMYQWLTSEKSRKPCPK